MTNRGNTDTLITGQRVLVFGATRGVGRQVLERALDEGHEVTAFVRDPARLDVQAARLRVEVGDVFDAARVAAVVPGHDVVVCALGAPATSKAKLRETGTRNIVAGMKMAGVERLVVLSSHGIAETAGELPWMMRWLIVPLYLKQAFLDHEAQEAVVKSSGLDWRIVRPVHLTDGPATGDYHRGFDAQTKITMKISRADVAHFMVSQMQAGAGQTVTPVSY